MSYRTLVAGLITAGSALIAMPAAQAAAPAHELPFPCGETGWRSTTYGTHGEALDFNWGSGTDDLGKTVVASASGKVTRAQVYGTYGNMVDIDHGGGHVTRYGHLQFPSHLSVGDVIKRGEPLGKVGSTGRSSGPHLHYEQLINGARSQIYFGGKAAEANQTFTSNNCDKGGPELMSGYGDFTGDGHADILGLDPVTKNGQLTLYRGTGKKPGSFESGVNFGSGWSKFTALLRGDYDGDEKQDILGRESNGDLVFYKGTGTGGVQAGETLTTTRGWDQFSQLVSPGDMNKNGTDDILAVRPDGKLFFYDGTDAPGVKTGVEIGSSGWNGLTKIVALGDINGDTYPDIGGVLKTGGALQLYTGNGTGKVDKKNTTGTGFTTYKGKIVALGNNGDSHPDLLGINSNAATRGELSPFSGTGNLTDLYINEPNLGNGWNKFTGLF